jgi:hypothetical protein
VTAAPFVATMLPQATPNGISEPGVDQNRGVGATASLAPPVATMAAPILNQDTQGPSQAPVQTQPLVATLGTLPQPSAGGNLHDFSMQHGIVPVMQQPIGEPQDATLLQSSSTKSGKHTISWQSRMVNKDKMPDKWDGPPSDINMADVAGYIRMRIVDLRREEMIKFVKEHPDLGLASMIMGIWTHTTSKETHSDMFEKKGFSHIGIACFVATTVAQVFYCGWACSPLS